MSHLFDNAKRPVCVLVPYRTASGRRDDNVRTHVRIYVQPSYRRGAAPSLSGHRASDATPANTDVTLYTHPKRRITKSIFHILVMSSEK